MNQSSNNIYNDKELLQSAQICIRILLQHFKGKKTKAELSKDLLIHDAIRYRMLILGETISKVSHTLKRRHDSFDWFISILAADEGIDVAWKLYKPVKSKIGSKNGFIILFEQLEAIYNYEFVDGKNIKNIEEDKTDLFNIKSSRSIRTVKK